MIKNTNKCIGFALIQYFLTGFIESIIEYRMFIVFWFSYIMTMLAVLHQYLSILSPSQQPIRSVSWNGNYEMIRWMTNWPNLFPTSFALKMYRTRSSDSSNCTTYYHRFNNQCSGLLMHGCTVMVIAGVEWPEALIVSGWASQSRVTIWPFWEWTH